ncbi:MAG: P-loop NTPase [Acidobacteria bacterium]|nr:P-loop NTPase [Acidobacteriota bacterium]
MKTYFDVEGDGGSDVLGQVLRQRERIAHAMAGIDHVVAIGSGKGGVGKSTLTMQLALALERAGRRCAILDADLNGPCQARLAGLENVPLLPGDQGMALPRTRRGLGVVSVGSMVPEAKHLEFDSVAEGDSHVWRATREFNLFQQLLGLVDWGRLDFLLVDLPPGAERTLQYAEVLGPAARFVLVTIPSALAHGVVARSAAALEGTPNEVIGFIENMSGYYCGACDGVRPLFGEVAAGAPELGFPCLARVPFDPRLASASDAGEPDPPRGPVLRAIDEAAARVLSSLARTT